MKRAIKYTGLAFLVALISIIWLSSPAFANDEPDEMVDALYDIRIFEDLITTGDFLAIVPYDIPFASTPDETINDTFLFRMLDGSTELGVVTAYPYYDKGYGKGVVSFYFESGTTWETAYTFRIQENPTYYPAALYWDFVINASNYSSDSDQSEALRAKIIDVGSYLSIEYDQELLTTAEGLTVLSTYGGLYFLNAIPGLQTMSPELFYLQVRTPSYEKRTWSYTLAESMRTRYDGTFIGDFMTGSAGMFSTTSSVAGNMISILLFAAIIFVSIRWFKGNTLSGFMDGYAFLLLLMLLGWFDMVLAGLMAFICMAIGGVVLFLNRS